MLAPDDRRTLLEALRPPEGYRIDHAVATTFSLDLLALLQAPVAFSLYDGFSLPPQACDRGETNGHFDPMLLLQSVRESAEHLTVFCQVGQIAAPGQYQRLLAYLESSVVQVQSPQLEGVFHPKVWILRFVSEVEPVCYRVICGSRNLTFDRSWDTMLTLDGQLTDRTRAYSENHPLGDFVQALPSLAGGPFRDRSIVLKIAGELRRTQFELPEGFESLAFHPFGLDNYRAAPLSDHRVERLLVVSPFLSPGALGLLTQHGTDHILVSRADELDKLPAKALEPFEGKVFVLQEVAEAPDDEEPERAASEDRPPLHGLHAKLLLADDGWDAHVWTGSLNATEAALSQNVEFMVELVGKKSVTGVEVVMQGVDRIVMPWTPPLAPPATDPIAEALEQLLRSARRALSDRKNKWRAVVGTETGGVWPLVLSRKGKLSLEAGIEVGCWPIMVTEAFARPIASGRAGVAAEFRQLSFDGLTSFFAFRVKASLDAMTSSETFVLNIPLEGAPADRQARVLQGLLSDPDKVLRFLRLLLASDPVDVQDLMAVLDGPPPDDKDLHGKAGQQSATPLLEALVRAASRDGHKVDAVARVIAELAATKGGAQLVPAGLQDLLDAVQSARKVVEEHR